nr:PD-(D/E)XK nuclease family protein [Rhodospirillales bacterium]
YDDLIEAAAADANLPLAFAHGRRALNTRDGQAAAALADVLLHGLSQDRVRRLIGLVRDAAPMLAALPEDWSAALAETAPLVTPERWERMFGRRGAAAAPVEAVLMPVVRLLHRGAAAAEEAGRALLPPGARTLWERALDQEPAEAIERALAALRVPDPADPTSSIVWAPAGLLAGAPRPFMRLLGLNAGLWPRVAQDDPLLPERIVGAALQQAPSLADCDRLDFAALTEGATGAIVLSYARRDASGRVLGRSPLLPATDPLYLRRARIPAHAASEADRLMARPPEFAATDRARAAAACWENWFADALTPHDGMVRADHPAILRALRRTHSASSLAALLRNPLGFVWRHALGLRAPDAAEEPLRLDAPQLGTLIHEILQTATRDLESAGGLARADANALAAAVAQAAGKVGESWRDEMAVPPAIVWRATLEQARGLALAALEQTPPLPGQRSFAELCFNAPDADATAPPWDATRVVTIPGTDLAITGRIDRLDLSADERLVRVIDYKTGQEPDHIADCVLAGGAELQRCLYACAVRALLGKRVQVEAALLYPRGPGYHPLPDTGEALAELAGALRRAVASLAAGHAVPGPDAGGKSDKLAFALPAADGPVLERKQAHARVLLGEAAAIWEAP